MVFLYFKVFLTKFLFVLVLKGGCNGNGTAFLIFLSLNLIKYMRGLKRWTYLNQLYRVTFHPEFGSCSLQNCVPLFLSWSTKYSRQVNGHDPKDKGELRNLSLSLFISKLIENLIFDLLIESWGQKIDKSQFGGRKGYSVVLYLIKLVDFILLNL